ncbi:hypothetical protein AW736_14340 [Termitidicoccus mucosus]|uniref:Glycoside hydrolase n=2 Tax=Termitidicoccus mucosus TaxID=1184151 RepID=A0A178IIV8_9BACT|nr:hypothetical protein AW736_14340 [Opitutaceae bacterium TSB47]
MLQAVSFFSIHADDEPRPSDAAPQSGGDTAQPPAWPETTRVTRPWTRWWWPGSAVDEANLTRELAAFAGAGLGGVEITPIYGARGFERRYIAFLSPRYIEVLRHTAAEAARLGLGVDMATGTGWPFGGPQVRPEDAELAIEITDGKFTPKPTDFRVKRSAPGGAGPVLNPYSTAALAHYLEPFTAALKQLPPGAIRAQFHDSFEYKANWAAELPDAFRKRHGYDLAAHAAMLAAAPAAESDADTIARIKSDYRETLAALHMDYVRAWHTWTRSVGGISREQAHGAPANLLDLYALSDIPETEIFGSTDFPIPFYRNPPEERSREVPQPLVNQLASSAAHVAGKKLASSEAFTWAREHFHEAPSGLKPELDQLFLTGINHIFYHGSCFSPADAPWPGWLFYASTQYNPRNPLWHEFAALNAYITRVQSFLQAGRPDNGILLYWPVYDLWHDPKGWNRNLGMHGHDWLTEAPAGRLAQALIDRGYTFDFVSDEQLRTTACVPRSSRLRTIGTAEYQAVLVPRTGHMPAATLRRLLDLASQGARILFFDAMPADVPGFARLESRRAEFAEQLARIELPPPGTAVRAAMLGKGNVYVGDDLDTLLGLVPVARETIADSGLRFVRRALPDGHIWFIANLTDKPYSDAAPLVTEDAAAALYDPLSGVSGMARYSAARADSDAGTPATLSVGLQLAPGQSIIVRTYAGEAVPENAASWTYSAPVGEPAALGGRWTVTFASGGPQLPPPFKTAALTSWTDQGGEAGRFAGMARYELDFELPAAPEGAEVEDWWLDLGDVRETARVLVNGRDVGLLWCLPFRARIGHCLRPGKNHLAIEVTNLAANRIRDLDQRGVVWKNFHEINFVNAHYKPLDAGLWPLQPSGLLGPVTLTPLKVER